MKKKVNHMKKSEETSGQSHQRTGPLTQSGGYGPNPPGSGAPFLNGHGVLWNV